MQKSRPLKIAMFTLRWGIAVLGITYVLYRMNWHDRVLATLPGDKTAHLVRTETDTAGEQDAAYRVVDPRSGRVVPIPASAIVAQPNLPRVQVGIIRMTRRADPSFLLLALAVFPITIIVCSFRWHELLKALDIRLTVSRTFVLNMVGLFYNTFMLGSTGGDVLRAYYVAKQTHHRARAVMSVLVDRLIGLMALVILGGVMAGLQWRIPECRRVALGSVVIVLGCVVALTLFYHATLRRALGLDWVIDRLPMQRHVRNVIETMHIYGRRPWLVAGAVVVSFPVHMTVIVSAYLCGKAFGLPITPFYYWMAVPVIVLAGSIPISPQGAGVMEYFAIKLLEPLNVTVAEAFALTMSIRLTQIFWNLTGGIFVLRGGYHAPTKAEEEEVEREDEDHDRI